MPRRFSDAHVTEGSMRARAAALRAVFRRVFGSEPAATVRAPGRVNLIGEHTDYNEGFVLPLAIDRDVLAAARPRDDDVVVAYTANFDRPVRFTIGEPRRDAGEPWSDYLRGVAFVLRRRGLPLLGMDLALAGSVPVGAGLGSSAALEVAVAWAFRTVGGFALDRVELALLCQRAESEFVGVRCGIMDQFVAALGHGGHALFLDCRDLSYRHVPLPPGTKVVVTDSLLRRELAHAAYNERRAECAEAVGLLRGPLPAIRSLRDVAAKDLAEQDAVLPALLRRRARHVVGENERVLQAVAALERGDAARIGRLMDEAHASLRDDYEVSLPELDLLVAAARSAGALGARLTGAGFGGCIVSLVPAKALPGFARALGEVYVKQTGRWPVSYTCTAADGAGAVP